jgi:hypothetical protein
MKKIRVGILGASGIGKFHAREFKNAGCDVVAILGSSDESVAKTRVMLKDKFGIEVKAYSNLSDMLSKEKLEVISVCSPPQMHYEQVRECLEKGLHVLCEKPFVLDENSKGFEKSKELFDIAESKKRVLSVNTQWPSVLKHVNAERIDSFSMSMEPGYEGIDILTDSTSHMNSMLIKLFGIGEVSELKFHEADDKNFVYEFKYNVDGKKCNAKYELRQNKQRPREVAFSINDKRYSRELDDNYNMKFVHDTGEFDIVEPLSISIGMFVSALDGGVCLVSKEEILENMRMQDYFVDSLKTQSP